MNGILGVLSINVGNSNVRILVKDYIGPLTLTIDESNVRSQKKKKLTNQLLVSEWSATWSTLFETAGDLALTHSHSRVPLEISSATFILLKITWE